MKKMSLLFTCLMLLVLFAAPAFAETFTATIKDKQYKVEKSPARYVGNYYGDARYDWKYTLNGDGTGSAHIQTTDAMGRYFWDNNDEQKITRWGVAVNEDGSPVKETLRWPEGVEAEIIVFEIEACSTGHGTCISPGMRAMKAYEWKGTLQVGSAEKQ